MVLRSVLASTFLTRGDEARAQRKADNKCPCFQLFPSSMPDFRSQIVQDLCYPDFPFLMKVVQVGFLSHATKQFLTNAIILTPALEGPSINSDSSLNFLNSTWDPSSTPLCWDLPHSLPYGSSVLTNI